MGSIDAWRAPQSLGVPTCIYAVLSPQWALVRTRRSNKTRIIRMGIPSEQTAVLWCYIYVLFRLDIRVVRVAMGLDGGIRVIGTGCQAGDSHGRTTALGVTQGEAGTCLSYKSI